MSAMPRIITSEHMTPEEYLEFERASDIKHEYYGGEIRAMSGGTHEHIVITLNTGASLLAQLRGRPCFTYTSEMKVRIEAKNSFFYPDIAVACGDLQFVDNWRDMIRNPMLVIEVLSPSTESEDRGEKFQHYRELGSLQEYVLIAQDKPYIERFLRQEGGVWQFSDAQGLDAVMELSSIGCTLKLADVYERVTFEAETDAS